MKNILILVQLTSHVISQDEPQSQSEVEKTVFFAGCNSKKIQEKIKRLPGALIYGVRKAGTRAILEFLRIHFGFEYFYNHTV